MYLRVTVPEADFDADDFPGALGYVHNDAGGVVSVYRACHEFAWEPDGAWWLSFDGGDSTIQSPEWDEWGLVAEAPTVRDGMVYLP